MVKTTYYVNKSKRTVVCVMDTFNDVHDKIEKYGLITPSKYFFEKKVFRGVAKCAPEDDWDETIGRRLAEQRAAAKRQNYVNGELNKFIDRTVAHLNDLIEHGLLKYPNPIEIVEEDEVVES